MNARIQREVCSAVSFREIARKLRIHRETVKRKVVFLGLQAELELERYNRENPLANVMEFDDMETFEHTKCKPLSITLAVEHKTRRILGFEVSQMPAKGRLARISVKKYGPRADHRTCGRNILFTRIKDFVSPMAEIRSDENPHYPATVRAHFPLATHVPFKGQRGSIVGQGELKKVRFDPLFNLNHTCAMIRDNLKRMTRRTWCTTKSPQMLRHCLAIYSIHHNLNRIVDD